MHKLSTEKLLEVYKEAVQSNVRQALLYYYLKK
jgi:hypothetical protein